jgi:hypothetical protein
VTASTSRKLGKPALARLTRYRATSSLIKVNLQSARLAHTATLK